MYPKRKISRVFAQPLSLDFQFMNVSFLRSFINVVRLGGKGEHARISNIKFDQHQPSRSRLMS